MCPAGTTFWCTTPELSKNWPFDLLLIFCDLHMFPLGWYVDILLGGQTFYVRIWGKNTKFVPSNNPGYHACWFRRSLQYISGSHLIVLHHVALTNFLSQCSKPIHMRFRVYFLWGQSSHTYFVWQFCELWQHWHCSLIVVAAIVPLIFWWFMAVFISAVPVTCCWFFNSLIFVNHVEA